MIAQHVDFPDYTMAERRADAVIHVLSVASSLMAMGALWAVAGMLQDGLSLASVIIYGLAVIGVFAASAAYNLVEEPYWKATLRRLDPAAIFVKIAGTYTPFALVSVGGFWGALLLVVVWGVALVGAPLKIFAPEKLEGWAHWLYLAQGWALVIAIWPMLDSLSAPTLILLLIGGVLYSVGVIFHLAERMPFHNAIWHGLVLTASGCMYAAVMLEVGLA